MEEMSLNDEIECHCRIVFKDKDGGVYAYKFILHVNRWDIYIKYKLSLIKVGYCVEVLGYDWKKVIWKVVGGHSVEEPKENNDIGLWGLILICLTSTRVGW